jgi:NitT/TauT family transport system permease protein
MRGERIILPLITGAAIVAVWEVAVVATHSSIFPSPIAVARGVGELVEKGLLFRYIRDSLMRVAAGYLIAAFAGVFLGMLVGRSAFGTAAINPIVQSLRPISPLAWMPLAVIWFGVGNSAPVFLIFIAAFFPILVATMNAVRNIPRMYLQAADNFGLSRWLMLRRVIFPAIFPRVLTALRIALGIAWLVLVAAEMIAVDSGLGYLVIDARNAGKRYDLVVAGMLLIGLVGLSLDLIVRRAESLRAVRWGFAPSEES